MHYSCVAPAYGHRWETDCSDSLKVLNPAFSKVGCTRSWLFLKGIDFIQWGVKYFSSCQIERLHTAATNSECASYRILSLFCLTLLGSLPEGFCFCFCFGAGVVCLILLWWSVAHVPLVCRAVSLAPIDCFFVILAHWCHMPRWVSDQWITAILHPSFSIKLTVHGSCNESLKHIPLCSPNSAML